MTFCQRLMFCMATLGCAATPGLGATFYATPGGTGDCLSWATACELNAAIDLSASDPNVLDSIWVKSGTYPPLELHDGVEVQIIGGFTGIELFASGSNPGVNFSIIDGGGTTRLATTRGHTSAMLFRGLRFAHGYDEDDQGGGALWIEDSNPTFVDCLFEYNNAYIFGGVGVISGLSYPTFVNCVFRHNGGSSVEDQVFVGGVFWGNQLYGNWTFTNCLFRNNRAWEAAVLHVSTVIPTVFRNCTIADNRGTITRPGGAIYTFQSKTEIRNCILWGNRRIDPNDPDNPSKGFYEQINNIGSLLTVSNSDVQGGWPGTGNINANPLFGVPTPGADYRIPATSPCKDTGANAFVPLDTWDLDWDGIKKEVLPIDLQELARIKDSTVDMGAYEVLYPEEGGGPVPE